MKWISCFVLLIALFFASGQINLATKTEAATPNCLATIVAGSCQIATGGDCPSGYEAQINYDYSASVCLCQCVVDDSGNSNAGEPDTGNDSNTTVDTAIGPISFEPSDLVSQMIRILIGIGGGIALVLMIFGSLQVVLSSGNPDKIKGGQEIITSAIMGLLFIIFSIFLLQFIGVDLFNIPGFGKG